VRLSSGSSNAIVVRCNKKERNLRAFLGVRTGCAKQKGHKTVEIQTKALIVQTKALHR
jgi:hypothetical protein